MTGRPSASAPRLAGGLRSLGVLPVLLTVVPVLVARPGGDDPTQPPSIRAVVLPRPVLSSMNARFRESNEHWEDAPEMNRLTQMLGTGGPTQLEYMGCLRGHVAGDTLRIRGWQEPRDLIRLQFAVDGSCDHVRDLVGTWHTHPYRADAGGDPVKKRSLSRDDLETFRKSRDLVIVAVWDVDSLDVAVRGPDGGVIHPAPLVVE